MDFEERELARQLVPALRIGTMASDEQVSEFGRKLVTECRNALLAVLPLTSKEIEFLDCLLDEGSINPEILTEDPDPQARIKNHPLLKWKALNVRKHRNT